MTKIQKGIFE